MNSLAGESSIVRTRIALAIISLLFAALLISTGYASVRMILFSDLIVKIMGVCLLILCAIAFWAGVRELIFGRESAKLLQNYLAEGHEPKVWSLDVTESGRISKTAAQQARTAFLETVDGVPEDSEDWRIQLELGMLTAASGSTSEGRKHTRKAIELAKQESA